MQLKAAKHDGKQIYFFKALFVTTALNVELTTRVIQWILM